MGLEFKDLGADILLVEHLLEPSLCDHVVQIAECCQFKPSSILINVVDTDVRSSGILALGGNESPLQESTNQLLLRRVMVVQDMLFKRYGIKFPHAEMCSILRYLPGQNYRRHVDNLLLESRYVEMAHNIPTRDISIVGYLNDNFEGGETFSIARTLKSNLKEEPLSFFPPVIPIPTNPFQSFEVKVLLHKLAFPLIGVLCKFIGEGDYIDAGLALV